MAGIANLGAGLSALNTNLPSVLSTGFSNLLNYFQPLADAASGLNAAFSNNTTLFNLEQQYSSLISQRDALVRLADKALSNCITEHTNVIPPNAIPPPPHINFHNLPPVNTNGVRSYDPNDIVGPAGYGSAGFVTPNETLPYSIDFTNEATATAPAQVVTVTEQLSLNLDWNTFQLGDISFGSTSISVPQGLMAYSTQVDATATLGVVVDVTAGINVKTGLVTWTFTSLDPNTLDVPADPLSGFLPPDQAPPIGEGVVSYSITPTASDPSGTVIPRRRRSSSTRMPRSIPSQSPIQSSRRRRRARSTRFQPRRRARASRSRGPARTVRARESPRTTFMSRTRAGRSSRS